MQFDYVCCVNYRATAAASIVETVNFMLAFAQLSSAQVKKSTEFCEYLDPLSVLDLFKLDYGNKSIIIESTLKEIYDFPFPGFNRIVEIPIEKLASTANEKIDVSTFLYFNIMCC